MICVNKCACTYSYPHETVPSILKISNGMKDQNADYKNTTLPHGIVVK